MSHCTVGQLFCRLACLCLGTLDATGAVGLVVVGFVLCRC
jgi:hypothetical protein